MSLKTISSLAGISYHLPSTFACTEKYSPKYVSFFVLFFNLTSSFVPLSFALVIFKPCGWFFLLFARNFVFHFPSFKAILKQLAAYYLCPAAFAAVIGGTIAVFVGENFNFYTGAHTAGWMYFFVAMALFFGIYAVYFAVTYIGFKRNVE